MKKFIFPLILSLIIGVELYFLDDITLFVTKLLNNHPEIVEIPSNNYKKNTNYLYVKETNDFLPYSYTDLLNIFYTILNSGWTDFTFYCPLEYENCVKDVQTICNNDTTLTNINNYVNPLNSFVIVNTSYDDSGEINIKIIRLYNDGKIDYINKEIDSIMNKVLNKSMSDREKIKALHDYIINNTKYDVERNEKGVSSYESNTSYGTLKEHMAICSGYADTMAIALNKLGIDNYKIASGTHVWNAVKLDGQWYHLDLTWDDPVSNTGEDILDYKFFLVKNKDLEDLDKNSNDHKFDKSIYLEFKNN